MQKACSGKRGLSWTSAKKSSVQDGRAEGGGFLPRAGRWLEVRKPWHARTSAAAELAASMTLKS